MKTPKIKTERLILREIKPKDIFGYSEILADKETMNLYGGSTLGSDLEIKNFVNQMRKQRIQNFSFFWSIVPKIENEFTGFIRLLNYESKYYDLSYGSMGEYRDSTEFNSYIKRQGWEVDYALLERHRGKGFMTEAIIAILDFAKIENLQPIYAKVNSMENIPTIRVLEKNNFQELLPQMGKDGKLGMIYKKEGKNHTH